MAPQVAVLIFAAFVLATSQFHGVNCRFTYGYSDRGRDEDGPSRSVAAGKGKSQQSVFSSGRPPSRYQTGGIVWEGQQLGVRFLARGASKDQGGTLLSKVEVYLETERLVTEGEENVIELRLCAASADDQALPVDPCVAESFRIMDRMRQGRATWVLKSDFTTFAGGPYWVMLQGRATDPSTSLSWLDGDVVFRSDDARSAYAEPSGTWVLDSTNHTVPSLDVYTSFPGTSRVALSVDQLSEAAARSLYNLEKLPAALMLHPTT
mmetsp:Transcript_9018/g.16254  ORF Transcript_9018/g.16254 Transcript_9018/m.16254 type:complete len:264 (-) Transcript_9018:90-881(-)|eukprot:CAMPEP_0177760964 /NCGR_PEP_ID=MMETSP0491_2-20121128/5549_1 /TAXON_ID=63592 /ORGANISM="Tetraselmis chuii, Strain PLY429" /LENGTH=263 /DNA_ID=CAMNT_0019276901 /DNA_START=264 /DNA_END=1055 /DNA_ORIENTATION=+